MDTKLKALKVVDLRQILATGNVSVTGRPTKNELIAAIQSNKPALDAYARLYPPDDLLAPPEEVDWNAEQVVVADPPAAAPSTPAPTTTTNTKPPSTKLTAPVKAVASTTTGKTTPSTAIEDPELERHKRRAERFGIPLVEPKQKSAKQPPQKFASGAAAKQLEARAERFEATDPKPNGKKRSAQTEDIDPEELQRRKKRSERFGLPVKT